MSVVAFITETEILVLDLNDAGLICQTLLVEPRPRTLADADIALAMVSQVRLGPWELNDKGGLSASTTDMDNRFNGVVAARIWAKVGSTHSSGWNAVPARAVRNGDLIADMDISVPYVVAGSDLTGAGMRVHMVGEGQSWYDRHTTVFREHQLVMVAAKLA